MKSTTNIIKILGFIVLAAVLLFSVYLGRETSTEMYFIFATYCGGLTVSKGIVDLKRQSDIKVGGSQ